MILSYAYGIEAEKDLHWRVQVRALASDRRLPSKLTSDSFLDVLDQFWPGSGAASMRSTVIEPNATPSPAPPACFRVTWSLFGLNFGVGGGWVGIVLGQEIREFGITPL